MADDLTEEEKKTLRKMTEVTTRLRSLRTIESALDEWLENNHAGINEYHAQIASIEQAKAPLQAELQMIRDGIDVVSAPSQEDVDKLKTSVTKLTQKIQQSKAADDFLTQVAGAVTEIRAAG